MKATFTETTATIDYRYFGEGIEMPNEEVITINTPELTGSEKQIDWAMDIRNREIMAAVDLFNRNAETIMKELGTTKKSDALQFIFCNNNSRCSWITTETSAKNIIENYR